MIFYNPFPLINEKPPTIYAILNSIVNFDAEEKTKIKDLASEGHETIFNFNYPLSSKVNKADFEILILNHYMMRRIGFETVTAFQIMLSSKLNEIMPMYNKLFDALEGWNLFEDGETETRIKASSSTNELKNNANSSNVNDVRSSNLPQGRLEDVRDASYVTNYDYVQNNGNTASVSSGTDSSNENETITRSPADKIKIYREFIEAKESIYTMIFKELDVLFYGLI